MTNNFSQSLQGLVGLFKGTHTIKSTTEVVETEDSDLTEINPFELLYHPGWHCRTRRTIVPK